MESECRRIRAEIVGMISGDKLISIEQLGTLCLEYDDIRHRVELCDLLTELRSDSIEITTSNDLEVKLHSGSVTASLVTEFTGDQKLSKICIVPETPETCSLPAFESAIDFLDARFEIFALSGGSAAYDKHCDDLPIAIASLVKIIVAGAIAKRIDEETLSLKQTYRIQSSDISLLSAGLSNNNVGDILRVSDLLALLLKVSDNTAMDILLQIGGSSVKEYIHRLSLCLGLDKKQVFSEVKATKDVYGSAWGIPRNDKEEGEVRRKALSEVRWKDGFDYFIPLSVVAKAASDLVKSPVYEQIFGRTRDFFKGGSAPGVISGLVTPAPESNAEKTITFALNRNYSFSLVEEIYVFDCARQLFTSEGFSFEQGD